MQDTVKILRKPRKGTERYEQTRTRIKVLESELMKYDKIIAGLLLQAKRNLACRARVLSSPFFNKDSPAIIQANNYMKVRAEVFLKLLVCHQQAGDVKGFIDSYKGIELC